MQAQAKVEAWNRQAGAWIRACELARSYAALPGETPLTVAWWIMERSYEEVRNDYSYT